MPGACPALRPAAATLSPEPPGEAGLGGDRLGAAAPHFLSATGPGSPVTAAAGGRSRDGNAVMSPAEGGGPQDGRRSPHSGHRRAAARRRRSPRGPEARAALPAPGQQHAFPGHQDRAQLPQGLEAKRAAESDHSVYRATAGWQPGLREHRGGGRCATWLLIHSAKVSSPKLGGYYEAHYHEPWRNDSKFHGFTASFLQVQGLSRKAVLLPCISSALPFIR